MAFQNETLDVDGVKISWPSKIPLIKAVRSVTGCDLKEAKDTVESFLASIVVTTTVTCSEGEEHEKVYRLHDDTYLSGAGRQAWLDSFVPLEVKFRGAW